MQTLPLKMISLSSRKRHACPLLRQVSPRPLTRVGTRYKLQQRPNTSHRIRGQSLLVLTSNNRSYIEFMFRDFFDE